MNIKGVFFDFYGTLVTLGNMPAAWADWLDAFYTGLVPLGLSLSKTAFGQCCDGFFTRDEPPAAESLTLFERRIQRVAQDLGLELPRQVLPALANGMAEAWQRHMRLDPQTPETLQSLRQTKTLALISNYDHPPYLQRLLQEYKLNGFFDAVIISGAVGCKKPDPAIFHLALKQTGLAAAQVMYVGDTQEDVQGALAAGITPVLIARRHNCTAPALHDFRSGNRDVVVQPPPPNSAPAFTIASLNDLLALA